MSILHHSVLQQYTNDL